MNRSAIHRVSSLRILNFWSSFCGSFPNVDCYNNEPKCTGAHFARTHACPMSPCVAQRIQFHTDFFFMYFIILLTQSLSKKLIYLDTHKAQQNDTFCSYSFIHSFVCPLIRAIYTLNDMSTNEKKIHSEMIHIQSACHLLIYIRREIIFYSLVFAFKATHIAIEWRKNGWHLNGISFPYGFCFPLPENCLWFGWQRTVVASLSFSSAESFSCRIEYVGMTFIVAPTDSRARRTFLTSGLDSGNIFYIQ